MTLKAAETPAKRKRGRPSKYTSEIASEVLKRLEQGQTLRTIGKDPDMPPPSTVRHWVVDDIDGFSAHYDRARESGYDAMAEQCVEIADRPAVESVDVNRHRLMVDTRKWLLSKMFPRRYGDRIETHHTGEVRTRASEDDGVLARAVVRLLNMAETVDGGELESQVIDNAGKATD